MIIRNYATEEQSIASTVSLGNVGGSPATAASGPLALPTHLRILGSHQPVKKGDATQKKGFWWYKCGKSLKFFAMYAFLATFATHTKT